MGFVRSVSQFAPSRTGSTSTATATNSEKPLRAYSAYPSPSEFWTSCSPPKTYPACITTKVVNSRVNAPNGMPSSSTPSRGHSTLRHASERAPAPLIAAIKYPAESQPTKAVRKP